MKLPWAKNKKQQLRQPRLMQGQESYIFRRSRTLSGTKSPQVPVGAPGRGQFKTDRIKLIELRAHKKRILVSLGGVLAVAAFLGFMVANFILKPTIIFTQQSKQPAPSTDPYSQTIYHYFDNHPFERFGVFLRATELETAFTQMHSEVRSVAVERDWYGGNVRFNITFRQPILSWQAGNKQFFVDAQGIAFQYNHFDPVALAITDQSGIPPDEKGVVVSARFLRFLGQLVAAINGYGLGAVEVVIIPATPREIDMKLQGREYLIKTNTDRDAGQQAEDIANALQYLDRKNIKPQYIDVRVAHRAFYR